MSQNVKSAKGLKDALPTLNRVVRKLQFQNNFLIKSKILGFRPIFYKTCETTNRVVEQVK